MSKSWRWRTAAVAVFGAISMGMVTAAPAFATETSWSNIEGWSNTIQSSDSASAIEWNNNQMSVWRGEGSGATDLWYSLNGSLPQRIAGGRSESAPTVVLWRGIPTVLVRADDNAIWWTYFVNGAWQAGWQIAPGGDTTLSTPMATVIRNNELLEVVYRGTNNRMYMFALDMHNGNPSDVDQIGQGEIPGGGDTVHSPAVARIHSIGGDDGLLVVHTGIDQLVYYQHIYVNAFGNPNAPGYLEDILSDGHWTELRSSNGSRWATNSRPTIATNIQNLGIIRVGMLDLDNNLAYIGGTNNGFFSTSFGNWQIEGSRTPLMAAPMLYNNTNNGEIDAIAFLRGALFHNLRVMRCD